MKSFLSFLIAFCVLQSCQLFFNRGIDGEYAGESFSRLAKLKGEWEVYSEVQIAFEVFEESKAEATIKADEAGQVLNEKFKGYYKDDKWTIHTAYQLLGEDSLEVRVSDSRQVEEQIYRGTFIEGFLVVTAPDSSQKLEMRLLENRLIKKLYNAAPLADEDWELVWYAEYVRD